MRIVLLLLISTSIFAQDSLWKSTPTINLSGFVDAYYSYDFNEPSNTSSRQSFFYNHNRHNEFNINLALFQVDLTHVKYRARLALQSGTYAADNYGAEQSVMRNMHESYVGIALDKKNKLWLDAGIFSSHLGFESAQSSDNYTLTRSFVAESSPYFLSGAKLTYTANDYIEVAAIVTNGWQRINRVSGNSLLSGGTQFTHTINKNIKYNWSTFIGTDDPDSTRRMMYFNNFYVEYKIGKVNVINGFDFGFRQSVKGSTSYDNWFLPVTIVQFPIVENWSSAVRAEWIADEDEVVISTPNQNGFTTAAFSLNVDYHPNDLYYFRVEGRYLNSSKAIFIKENGLTSTNLFITTSIAVKI